MLPANKHMDPVVGVDIHITLIPSPAGPIPTPLPYPFVGMVMDPMDYIPVVGATIMVNKKPRGNSTTAGMLGSKVHIPMGGPLQMSATIGHDSMNFFGSPRVVAEGSYMSGSGYMVMSCNDVGMPLTAAPGKKMKPKPGMYLPSSATIPIPAGPPVIVGGPYAPDLMAMVMSLVMSYGMGACMKAAGKGLKKLNHAVLKKFPATKGLSKKLCKMGFEPVDLITGRMVYEGDDFSLPGIIPITWERNWYSDSSYQGVLGYGNSCNYDLALHIEEAVQQIVMRLPDGRVTNFPLLIAEKDSFYDRSEKLTLTCVDVNTYTVRNHATELTYIFKRVSSDLFKPVKLQNDDGIAIQFKYNAAHQLDQIIDTAGRRINLTLDEEARITEINAIHEGEQRLFVKYSYNKEGDLVGITDALDQTTKMEYENHLMVKKTDRNGMSFYWEYDGKETGAKCIKTWGDGNVLAGTIEYGKGENFVTNSLGEESIYYFDSNNLCTQVTNPEGGHIFHEYTDFMEPYRDIDEEGNATGYSYDEQGNLTGFHFPDGAATTFAYDDKDRLFLTKNAGGGTNVRVYENEKLHATIDTAGAVTTFAFNNLGLITSVFDNAGNETKLEYDSDHNLHKLISGDVTRSSWRYNAWGNVTETSNSQKHKQQFVYDALGRVSKVQQADKNLISLKYNAYDDVIESVDSHQVKKCFEYTPLGKLKMREQGGVKVHFKYNSEEQIIAIINEHDEYYRIGRNKKGEIINEAGFDGLRKDIVRDRAGKILKLIRPGERFSEYEYDLAGRVGRVEHFDKTWETYSYDETGILIEAVNQDSRVSITRDKAGNITHEDQDGHSIESAFDGFGNRIHIESSLGANIELGRNQYGSINEINAVGSLEGETWNAKMSHNSIGQELERILPGGVINEMKYDDAGRPIQQIVSRSTRHKRNRIYSWNVNDQLVKMVNYLTSGEVNYSYDAFENLAGARYEDRQFDYKLPDEVGNLYGNKEQSDRKYGAGGRLLEANGETYKYDPEGNLITKSTRNGNWEYSWLGNGLLKQVDKPNGDSISFEYDALARRTAKIVKPRMGTRDTIITRWMWDGGVPLHEWKYKLHDRPKWIVNEENEFVKDKEEPIEDLITWIFNEGTYVPAAKIMDGEQYSIITDYLGTPVEMYNASGELSWEVEYDIYGKIRKQLKGGPADCPFRFQGQYEDVETGLSYNRFRYYSGNTGTYLSQDPIGIDGGLAMYAYVHNSNSWLDVLGLFSGHWYNNTKKDGTPHKKPGPVVDGGPHNDKIDEVIAREKAKGHTHVGGGNLTEKSYNTAGGTGNNTKPVRRMDASFRNKDTGKIFHINVGRTWADYETPIAREQGALDDMRRKGHTVSFEGYAREVDCH